MLEENENENENIYPNIPTTFLNYYHNSDEVVSDFKNETLETLKLLDSNRIRKMNKSKEQLIRDLKDFKRKKKLWNKIDNIVLISGGIIITGTGIGAALFSTHFLPLAFILGVPKIKTGVSIGLSVSGLLEGAILSGINIGIIKKKKDYYKNKIRIAQSHIDKIYYYIEKSKEDGKITLDELTGFRNIVDNYRNEIDGLKTSQFDLEHFKKEVQQSAKKEVKKEIKKEMKEDLKSQYHANVSDILPQKI